MYLKSLQVVGFKSFADKTTLEFHRGVTAIVGPNGCGKSNVLDSIRWVLGEQSAKALRGGEMRDVIFSGTDTRPALGMAEVSLTFAECEKELGTEFHEVTLTRRVFRDGASEYEINRTGCRLRDIQELFMDTGVGRSAYSIMEQGKIDLILSSRPEDRRAIFEEAAGITKYKSQKKEALRKLESTEANLLRLADVIREVKRQVGSLQRQAAKARRYQTALEELTGLERRFGRHQFNVYCRDIAALEAVVGTARTKQEEVTEQVSTEEARTEEARAELSALDAELSRLREEQGVLRNAVERSQQRAQSNRIRVDEFTKMSQQARQEVESTAEKIAQGKEQLTHLTAQVEQFRQAQVETKKQFDLAQQALQEITRRLNQVCGEAGQVEQQKLQQERLIQRQEQEAATLAAQQNGFQERFQALRLDENALLQRVTDITAQVQTLTEKVKHDETLLRDKKSAVQQAQQLQREAEEAVRLAERQRNDTNRVQQTLQARRDALSQLQKQNVDAPQATQRLLKTGAAELLGTLAQRISVKSGYEKPMALLLGEAFQGLLLQDEQQTVAWRQRLSRNEQCVFAPIAAPRFISAEDATLPPTCARHFVTADESVTPLLNALLEEAHVATDLAAAWALKAAHRLATVVTEQGELISRSGLLFVGQDSGAALAVLGRQAELRKLEAEILAATAQNSQAQAQVEAAQAQWKERQAQTEVIRQETQALEIALATVRQEERTSRAGLDQLTRQRDQTGRELTRLTEQEREARDRLERLQAAMSEARRLGDTSAEKWTLLQDQRTELQERERTQNAEVMSAKLKLSSQTHQCEAWQQQLAPVACRVEELTELNRRRTAELKEHHERVEKAQEEIVECEKTAENKAVLLATVVQLVETTKNKRGDLHARIVAREAALRTMRHDQSLLQQTRSTDEVALAEQRLFLNNLRERFRRDYQKELEELPRLPDSDIETDWVNLEADAREKRTALEAMGSVNLEAISEYDELEQRQTFLTAQEADLIKARDQLLQAIKEINQTTQRLFFDTFQQIKKNFQEMFMELFGGGKADLILLDENDPLESGIEIVAKPPGKQPQSVTLLSGGEKTMTAVALLFSIYLVKPSPFCVLDEMDAPLDESNINRFIKILQRFVHQSQFVVITHNKRTISIADVLYGVTMEERGVSRFVSMRLSKAAAPLIEGTTTTDSTAAEAFCERDDGVPSLADAVSRN